MARDRADELGGSLERARVAQIAVHVVVGAALLAAVLQNYAGVRGASRMLMSAQGASLLQSIRRLAPGGVPPTPEALAAAVERGRAAGLRCAALVERAERVTARAGDCETPEREMVAAVRTLGPGEVEDLGGRTRMADRLPPAAPGRQPLARPDARAADRPPPPPPPGGDDPRPRGRRPPPDDTPADHLVIEFEPQLAWGLHARATRGLILGVAATLALAVAAVFLSRLSRRAEALRQALERDRRLAALGEMSAVLAHEIRNPLASLKGHAQLLEEQLEPARKGKAERIVHEALRLEALCEDLLGLVRSNRVERRDTDPAALLREAVASVPEQPFDLALGKAPRTWSLDAQRMHQVLVNLLRNAAQASPRERPAQASIDVEADRLVFAVRDFGAGVASGDEQRIFEPFHTTRVRGTGLGLAVARRIVELHGGTVTVCNHPQGGAVFRVAIPRSR